MKALLNCLSGVLLLFTFAAKAAESMTLPVKNFNWGTSKPFENLAKAEPDVMTVNGREIPCMKYTLKYAKGETFQIYLKNIPKIDMKDKYPLLTVYFESDKKDLPLSKLAVLFNIYNKNIAMQGNFKDLTFNGEPVSFRWAPMYQIGVSRDMSELDMIIARFRLDAWEEGETMTFKISDFQFSGMDGGGDILDEKRLAKWKKWLDYRKKFKPDYSDSSAMLEPPVKGRLKKPLPLAVKGKPNAEIIIHNPDTVNTIRLAAEELQHWIKEISGAELPIVAEPSGAKVRIHLNSPEAMKKYAKDAAFIRDLKPNYGEDGFFIRTSGNDVYICGATSKGVLNGAYRFLENNSSIIWARPVAFGTVYDKDPGLAVRWGNGREKPRSFYRGLGYGIWASRNGGNFNTKAEWMGKGHIIGNFSDYLPNKPPYQCYVDGKYLPFGYLKSQVCISQPDSFDLIFENMMKKIKALEEKGIPVANINWCVEDNYHVCTCKGCTAPITLPDGRVIKSNGISQKSRMTLEERFFRSNQFYAFANRLAKALAKERPGIKLHLLAYFFMETAPAFPLEENIMVTFAPLYSHGDYENPVYAPANDRAYQNREKLRKVTKHLNLYDYYFTKPTAEVMKEDIQDFLENGGYHIGSELLVDGAGADSRKNMDFNNIDNWIYMRLSWDYTQDVEQLRKYYLRRVFHEGAPVLEKFYGLIRQDFFSNMIGTRRLTYNFFLPAVIFPDGRGEAFLREMQKTLPEIKNPIARINFARFMRTFEEEFNDWQVKTGKRQEQDSLNGISAKEFKVFRDTLFFQFRNGPDCTVESTTLEYNGKFFDGARFHFRETEKTNPRRNFLEAGAGFRAKLMGVTTPIPVPGIVKFKVRLFQPVENELDLPRFNIGSNRLSEDMNCAEDSRKIGENVYQYSFYPENEELRKDITWLRFRLNKSCADPEKGFMFEIFDFELEPVKK